MKNADSLSARILFLEGLPNLQDLGKLNIGETPVEIIRCDLTAAEQHQQRQTQVAKILGEAKDFVSQELIKSQIAKNEDYIDWLEEQNNLIFELGVEKFLQKNISS